MGLAARVPQYSARDLLLSLDAAHANTLAFELLTYGKAGYLSDAADSNTPFPHPAQALAEGPDGVFWHQLSSPRKPDRGIAWNLAANAAIASEMRNPEEVAAKTVAMLRGNPNELERAQRLALAEAIVAAAASPDFDPSPFLIDPRTVDLRNPPVSHEELLRQISELREKTPAQVIASIDQEPVSNDAIASMRKAQVIQDAAKAVRGLVRPHNNPLEQ